MANVAGSVIIGITSRLKTLTDRAIGRHRRSQVVRALHGFASFVESSYANEDSNFNHNGEQVILEKLRRSNSRIAFDVRANIADWAPEAIAFWPGCHVLAFEVAPPTFESLRQRLDSSDLKRVLTLNGFGLSDEEDKYCDTHQIDAVDFLKIDMEGCEYRVFRGFNERLSPQKIHCIQFEYGAFATQTKFPLGDYYAMLSKEYWIGKIYQGYVDFRDYHWKIEDFRFSAYYCVSRLRPDFRATLAG